MATPEQIRDAVDARLAAVWPTLVARQDSFRAARGRYFQGLRTHGTVPADGAVSPADRLSAHPTDQPQTWVDAGFAAWTEACSLEMHAYDGPAGRGWVAAVRLKLGGQAWERWVGQGPEARDRPWAEVG